MQKKEWFVALLLALFVASPALAGGSDTGGPQDEGSAPRPEGNEPRIELGGPILQPVVRLGGIDDIGPKSR